MVDQVVSVVQLVVKLVLGGILGELVVLVGVIVPALYLYTG
jgi:hypothetical protein